MKYHTDPRLALAKSLGLSYKKTIRILSDSYNPKNTIIQIISTKLNKDSFHLNRETIKNLLKFSNDIKESGEFVEIKEKYINVFEKSSQCAFLYSALIRGRRFNPETEKNMFLCSENNTMWLLEYWNFFFEQEETLPENQHNFMVSVADIYAREYLETSRAKIEKNQDAKNIKLVCDAFKNFFNNSESTKDIPRNQIERIIKKLVNFS